ncbi:MAG TPA: class I SAM-dependent methyltransferase [Polyangium sp.]|nr:class I SAM-dependent methyltransferase [Polyangium sp.]
MKRQYDKFTISVEARTDQFTKFPSAFQKEWMLGRALGEFSDDLEHLDELSGNLVLGVERPPIDDSWENSAAAQDAAELIIQGQQVMQSWERPLMQRMAQAAARNGGDVLEVGFGMGISASFILDTGVRSYTVIECNDGVIEGFERWRERYPQTETRLVRGRWQDVAEQLGHYDGILFDTYPLSQDEYVRNEVNGRPYSHAGEFFPLAASKLRPGGVFTYFTCEVDSLSRGHQRLLLRHFDSFQVTVVSGLTPPVGCQYWWANSMVMVTATRV